MELNHLDDSFLMAIPLLTEFVIHHELGNSVCGVTYNEGLRNSMASGVQIPLTNLSRILMKASPLPLSVPIKIMTR